MPKISKQSFILMLAVAIISDLISAGISIIPVLGQALNPIFSFVVNLSLWLWAAMNGFGFKGAMYGGAGMVIELIPLLGALPTFTGIVVGLYLSSKIKEKIPAAGMATK